MKRNVINTAQDSHRDINLSRQKDTSESTSYQLSSVLNNEALPKYSCSVHKVGICHAKLESNSMGKKPWRRPWRHIFMELRGTVLKMYEIKTYQPLYLPSFPLQCQQTFKFIPLANLSLVYLQAKVASDYKKRSNVFRIKDSRLRLLIQVQTVVEMFSWIEKMGAASNIAIDLDYPAFQER